MAIIFFLIVGVIIGFVIDSIGIGLAIGAGLFFVFLVLRAFLSYMNPNISKKWTPQNTVLKQFKSISARNVSAVMKKYREMVMSHSSNPIRDTAACFYKLDSQEMNPTMREALSCIEGIVFALSVPYLTKTMAFRICQFCSLVSDELAKYPDRPVTTQQQLEAAYKFMGVYDIYLQQPELFTNHIVVY